MNDAGTVAFGAEADTFGPASIRTGAGGPITLVADRLGAFALFNNFGPAINNAETVAFWASLDAGGQGIFLGPDSVGDKLIGTGDTLFGSTVTALEFGRFGLNNNGQIAFLAFLQNGDQVIVRADPISVIPEPSNLSLAAFALFSLGVLGWRRRPLG